jgi:hypothetical protein
LFFFQGPRNNQAVCGSTFQKSSTEAATISAEEAPPPDVPNNVASKTVVRNDALGVALEGEEEELHLPAGQHLLLDIDNVDATFLNSQKQLAETMVAMVYDCCLTMLSYHCLGLEPTGVSYAGVLLESHVAGSRCHYDGLVYL